MCKDYLNGRTNTYVVILFIATRTLAAVEGYAKSVLLYWTQVSAVDGRHAGVISTAIKIFTTEGTWKTQPSVFTIEST